MDWPSASCRLAVAEDVSQLGLLLAMAELLPTHLVHHAWMSAT
jgi:hypothetical protein